MGTLALCNLGLDDWQYHVQGADEAGDDAAVRKRLKHFVLPICLAATTFYREHYKTDGKGKLDMFPSQAEETWQCPQPHNRSECTTNPSSDIAGLWAITSRLLSSSFGVSPMLTATERAGLRELLQKIPPLPQGPRPYQVCLPLKAHFIEMEKLSCFWC